MKKCSVCKLEKSLDAFPKEKKKKDGLSSRCKNCNSLVAREYYRKNGYKAKQIVRAKARLDKQREYLNEIKHQRGCKFCSECEPCCLDFHHLDPTVKEFNLGRTTNVSIKKRDEELAKCIVVCSNCHRKIHAGKIKLE